MNVRSSTSSAPTGARRWRSDGSRACGIRCLYHGWKFAVDGTIQETPNMPADSRFRDRNRLLSYPVREAGGLIRAYLGPPERQPAFPDYFWFHARPEQLNLTELVLPCNYLQVHGARSTART